MQIRADAGLLLLGAPIPSDTTVRNYFGLAEFLEGRATIAAVDKLQQGLQQSALFLQLFACQ